ncbi:Udp-glycosyltransferase [Thalictrum thalictroides]|uniref:Udp-glycosyltransferase n=1 Tax=Thalictrum thalictroides TaxID=46969 RepID=A0A7J6VJ59_THATH|nr:Udp-glycosyltransferase [Thalictrum thalictroides]
MDDQGKLHIVMLPWLAMGHIIPFLELSKCLAQKGHRISFVSTPRNIKRLPKIPPKVSHLINLVELPLPHVDNLPEDAEATIDLPPNKVHYLKKAFDELKYSVDAFLEDLVPDWVIYDFAAYWLPPLASKMGVSCAFFSLFNAASVAFFGPPSVLTGEVEVTHALENNIMMPKWMPSSPRVFLRLYEIVRLLDTIKENVADVSDGVRYGLAVSSSDIVFIRSCVEFEQFWLDFVEQEVLQKPIIPVGLLPPTVPMSVTVDVEDGEWVKIKKWLDKQSGTSVVYIALGTEATLTQQEISELSLGLELSELPFFWVLRKPLSAAIDFYVLPDGFEDRIKGRGVVWTGWAPQLKILAHPSVGGFLTHCGWNSIIESLSLGCALILLPLLAEQGLNARKLHEDKVGLELPRDQQDGSFTSVSVAETLRMVMVDEIGEPFRANAREMRKIFGDKDLHDGYIINFIKYLQEHKHKKGKEIM